MRGLGPAATRSSGRCAIAAARSVMGGAVRRTFQSHPGDGSGGLPAFDVVDDHRAPAAAMPCRGLTRGRRSRDPDRPPRSPVRTARRARNEPAHVMRPHGGAVSAAGRLPKDPTRRPSSGRDRPASELDGHGAPSRRPPGSPSRHPQPPFRLTSSTLPALRIRRTLLGSSW